MTNLQIPKTKAGRPTKNRANGSKKIKKAALYEFARGGFQGTSISQIAETAGVARPLIQHHFSGKEDLWKKAVFLITWMSWYKTEKTFDDVVRTSTND